MKRIEALEGRIAEIKILPDACHELSSDFISKAIKNLEAIPIDDSWEEFAAEAARAKDFALQKLRAMLEDTEIFETEEKVLDAMISLGLTEDQGRAVVTAIVRHEVPHVEIHY